jgi:hypothetical protein
MTAGSRVIPTEVEESLTISEIFRDVSTPLDMTTLRSQSAATEELLRAFFEGGGFTLKVRERFTGEMK